MIGSHEERDAIRGRLGNAFGELFIKLEAANRGLATATSPVLSVARAMEAQQRAIQLLHSRLAAEAQHREAAEAHARALEDAFDTLQLRIQAQLPGPPTMATLQEMQAAGGERASAVPPLEAALPPSSPQSQARALIFQQDGEAAWAPDLGPGQGPVPRPPVAPKERKPVPPPTFRRPPSGLRILAASPTLQATGQAADRGGLGE